MNTGIYAHEWKASWFLSELAGVRKEESKGGGKKTATDITRYNIFSKSLQKKFVFLCAKGKLGCAWLVLHVLSLCL